MKGESEALIKGDNESH